MYCTTCGTELSADARFCAQCGTVVSPAEPGPTAQPETPRAEQGNPVVVTAKAASPSANRQGAFVVPASYRTNVELNGKPLELWAVVALFALAGIYLLQLSLRALPDSFRVFSIDFFPHSLAFVLLILVLLVGALGAALIGLGWLLQRGDRVGRGLAYVTVGTLVGLVLFGQGATTGEVLSMLAGIAAAAVLALAPAVQDVFTGPQALTRDEPTSIVVARVALAIWLILLAVAAVLDFCLADIEGKYAAYGILLAAVAAGGFTLFRRLGLADPRARVIVSAAAAVALLLLLLGRHDTGFALLFGLTVSIPICLWLPADARAFYGDKPLVTRQP